MDRKAWWATVTWGHEELDMTDAIQQQHHCFSPELIMLDCAVLTLISQAHFSKYSSFMVLG